MWDIGVLAIRLNACSPELLLNLIYQFVIDNILSYNRLLHGNSNSLFLVLAAVLQVS